MTAYVARRLLVLAPTILAVALITFVLISQRDYSMIMATTLIYGVLVALANLSVDIVYSFLDPRIRLA